MKVVGNKKNCNLSILGYEKYLIRILPHSFIGMKERMPAILRIEETNSKILLLQLIILLAKF